MKINVDKFLHHFHNLRIKKSSNRFDSSFFVTSRRLSVSNRLTFVARPLNVSFYYPYVFYHDIFHGVRYTELFRVVFVSYTEHPNLYTHFFQKCLQTLKHNYFPCNVTSNGRKWVYQENVSVAFSFFILMLQIILWEIFHNE